MRRHRRGLRFVGFTFVLFSSILLGMAAFLLADPESTIEYNGVVTSDPSAKRSFAVGLGAFMALGVFFLAAPRRLVDRIFLWRQSARYALFPWLQS